MKRSTLPGEIGFHGFIRGADSPGQVGYGFGLEQYDLAGGVEVIGHVGGTSGYLSFVGYLPAQNATLAMTINNRRGNPLPVIEPTVKLLADT